ncbi:unnamed protein product [Gongylonema pulchrum]|uniref:Uncharacterized protein n=1 Tax=Gongylonema pulchrum TaxID=637853 RepID=A0A3P7NSC3_9BILA|nr:unnamed protein product [Gongylonema pulchrum]
MTDFVNQRTADELDRMFADRYTMDNVLYAEVASGFPDPIVLYPWNPRPKRSFNNRYSRGSGGQRRPWRAGRQRGGWEGWRNSGSDSSYTSQGSRKRRNPDMDRDRMYYPGSRNDD